MVDLEELVGAEWAEWYRLTPAQRWLESEKLWQTYLALGGSLESESADWDSLYDSQARRPRFQKEIEQLWSQCMRSRAARRARASKSSVPKCHDLLIAAINNRQILKFSYEGYARVAEPQTYGMSYTGRYVLRAYQTGSESRPTRSEIAKLFDVGKISKIQKPAKRFKAALASHNPQDSAMKVVFATLPKSSA